jgi:hypothetical protein
MDRKLEIRDVGAAVLAAQPVLRLGEVIVTDPAAVKLAEYVLGGAEIGGIAPRLGDRERSAVDPSADQRPSAGEQKVRHPLKRRHRFERATLAVEQMPGDRPRPPRRLVDAP